MFQCVFPIKKPSHRYQAICELFFVRSNAFGELALQCCHQPLG